MLENRPLQVFLHATFRKLHSPGKPSCLLILYNPCFSHYLNYYPSNLSCLCSTCLPSAASSVEWGMGLALSRSSLLSESSSNSNKSCICLCFTLCSVWIWWKSPLAHLDCRTGLPEALRDSCWTFFVSTDLPVFTEAQEHRRCSGCLREGLILYLKMEWKKGQKLGKILL